MVVVVVETTPKEGLICVMFLNMIPHKIRQELLTNKYFLAALEN